MRKSHENAPLMRSKENFQGTGVRKYNSPERRTVLVLSGCEYYYSASSIL